jgi:hypothetical protein
MSAMSPRTLVPVLVLVSIASGAFFWLTFEGPHQGGAIGFAIVFAASLISLGLLARDDPGST